MIRFRAERGVPILLALALLGGCAAPALEYRAVPAWLLPPEPDLPNISGVDLLCLSDATYLKLVERDRARADYARQLRALLEAR